MIITCKNTINQLEDYRLASVFCCPSNHLTDVYSWWQVRILTFLFFLLDDRDYQPFHQSKQDFLRSETENLGWSESGPLGLNLVVCSK